MPLCNDGPMLAKERFKEVLGRLDQPGNKGIPRILLEPIQAEEVPPRAGVDSVGHDGSRHFLFFF